MTRLPAGAANDCWSMDFVSDALFDGRRIRALTLVDNFTRESLAIEVGQGLRGEHVVAVLDQIVAVRGVPRTIRADNGPEFVSKRLDQWAYAHHVTLDFSRPGTPTDNAYVESFNGRFREECLHTCWFLSLDDAREKIEAWRRHYAALQREPTSHRLGAICRPENLRPSWATRSATEAGKFTSPLGQELGGRQIRPPRFTAISRKCCCISRPIRSSAGCTGSSGCIDCSSSWRAIGIVRCWRATISSMIGRSSAYPRRSICFRRLPGCEAPPART